MQAGTVLKKIPKLKTDTKKPRQNRSSALGGLRDVVISACDTLLTYTALFKDGACKHKRMIERSLNRTDCSHLIHVSQMMVWASYWVVLVTLQKALAAFASSLDSGFYYQSTSKIITGFLLFNILSNNYYI